jgi:hypothetical protein
VRRPQYLCMISSIKKIDLSKVFSIDVRSLALVRVALAIIILQDLARRAFDIAVFYGDGGVLPSEYLHTFWNGTLSWSLHLIDGGETWFVAMLFIAHALFTCAFLFGFHTRIATIAVWLLAVSLHNANPLILQGEDVLLRVVLFVCIFLPLGAVYSMDRLRSGAPAEKTILSGWTVAYLLQIAFLYFFVALYKHSPEWIHGDAIYYALSIDQYATSFGRYLLNFPDILSFVTVSVLIFQSAALFLLFLPFWNVYVRTITVALLMLMHAGFAASMNLGMFSAVSIAALCGFIAPQLWDWFERMLIKRGRRIARAIREFSVLEHSHAKHAPRRMSHAAAFVSLLGVVYIFYIFIWHSLNVLNPGQYVPFAHGFEVPAKVLRLDQRWNLFAPYPYRDDGWIVVPALLGNGESVDLFRGGAELTFDRPETIYDLYPRPRWRRYLLSLRLEGNEEYRVPYAQYMCRIWNGSHPLERHIDTLSVVRMLEWTPAPGEAQRPIEQETLITWSCANNTVVATN